MKIDTAIAVLLAGTGALQAQGSGQGPVDPVMFEGDFETLQPMMDGPGEAETSAGAGYYVPSTPETVLWGYLPNAESEAVLTVPSGSVVTFDTVSHEGILEDQGRDPVAYFARFGVTEADVIEDAVTIAAEMEHDFAGDGPHVVTGPIAIEGAEPGDVLKVEVLSIEPRTGYGVVSNRHGKGALPGDFPETPEPAEDAGPDNPEAYHNVSIFSPVVVRDGEWFGLFHNLQEELVEYPIRPFMGLMGVAPDTAEAVNSVPPAAYGGNMDINMLGAGSTVYYPIAVAGALFYTGDPHAAQGDGEVALTALEHSMRPTFRLTLLEADSDEIPVTGGLSNPVGETEDPWIAVGLDEDRDEAMKEAVRQAIGLLTAQYDMDRATALAYLSAATDFEVSQVVDITKGVHGLIDKSHFANIPAE